MVYIIRMNHIMTKISKSMLDPLIHLVLAQAWEKTIGRVIATIVLSHQRSIHGNDMTIASSNVPLCIKDRFEALHNDPEDSQNVSFRVKDHDFFVRL